MISSLLQGLTLGLVLALMVGPVFFMILNTSIKKGFKPAAYMAAGVVLSDAFFIALALFGTSKMEGMSEYNYAAGFTGGLLLITFGLISIFKKVDVRPPEAVRLPDDSKTLLIDTGKGFMMNTLNPFVLIFWIGIISVLQTGIAVWQEKLVFLSTVLVTVFSTDLVKAYLASKLKKLLTPRILLLLNRASGIGLVIFGLRLLYKITVDKV